MATLLNICDNPNQLKDSSQILREAGYHVIEANGRAQALQHSNVDLIILHANDDTTLCCLLQSKLNTQHIPLLRLSNIPLPPGCCTHPQVATMGWPLEVSVLMDTIGQLLKQHSRPVVPASDPLSPLSGILENSCDFVCIMGKDGQLFYINPAGRKLLGLLPEEKIQNRSIFEFMPDRAQQSLRNNDLPRLFTDGLATGEGALFDAFGNEHPLSQILISHSWKGEMAIASIGRDISPQKQAEQDLLRLNRTFTVLSKCNEALMQYINKPDIYSDICNLLINAGGYSHAVISIVQQQTHLTAAAHAGFYSLPFPDSDLSLDPNNPLSQSITCQAFIQRKTMIHHGLHIADPLFKNWQAIIAEYHLHSQIALPLQYRDEIYGVLSIYATGLDIFNPGEVQLLQELANNLSFCIFTRNKQMKLKLAEQKLHLFERAIEASVNGIMITDAMAEHHPVLYINTAFERITGYSTDHIIGQSGRVLLGNNLDQPELEHIRHLLRHHQAGHAVVQCFHKNGTPFSNELFIAPVPDHNGQITHYISVINDVSDRIRHELQLIQLATHDPLTGLANRALFNDHLCRAITRSERYSSIAAILLLDLDRFKNVNDSMGHATGDTLLKLMTTRLRALMRAGDTIARMGGDEFAIVTELVSLEDAAIVARKILASLAEPFDINGSQLCITASIGISFCPQDGKDPESLLLRADIALYKVKENGRNNFRFFTQEMNIRTSHSLEMESALRKAIENNEFELYYQPKIDVYSGEIAGVEALLRWQHPSMGQVQPNQFIPFAEESGIILPLGEWVLNEACRQTKQWQKQGLLHFPVSVNLSALQFKQDNLVEMITRALADNQLEGKWLELELTESVVMENLEIAVIYLNKLKKLGISLSMDDFGTGYSSLGYLKQLPIDTIKIDRSFITNVINDPNDALITIAIITMAHSLRLNVVAEGVETESQMHFLHRQHCDQIQGFYYSKPLCADELFTFISEAQHQPATNLLHDNTQRTLLIVDDEQDILNALKRLFRRSGYTIYTANSAAAALELLAINSIQVIISDQRMPQMNGSEFLSHVRELYPQTVRMMLSGYTELSSLTDAINSGGIFKFLTKPWEDDDLLEQIRHAFAYHDQIIQSEANGLL